jgi:hypothetical protein
MIQPGMKERSENKTTGTWQRGNSAAATPSLHSHAAKSSQMIIKSKNVITFAICKGISGLKQICQAIAGQSTIICKEILGQVNPYRIYYSLSLSSNT